VPKPKKIKIKVFRHVSPSIFKNTKYNKPISRAALKKIYMSPRKIQYIPSRKGFTSFDVGVSPFYKGETPSFYPPSGAWAESIRMALLRELDAYGNAIKKVLNMTTENWENEKPTWTKRVRTNINDFGVSVFANMLGDLGTRKWNWLDRGTAIRWAVMGGPARGELFWPKTSRGNFRSNNYGGKHGNTLIKGMGAMGAAGIPPRPGIEGRFWTNRLMSRVRDTYSKDMQRAITSAVLGLKGPKRIAKINI
jgi:hypothetical protein